MWYLWLWFVITTNMRARTRSASRPARETKIWTPEDNLLYPQWRNQTPLGTTCARSGEGGHLTIHWSRTEIPLYMKPDGLMDTICFTVLHTECCANSTNPRMLCSVRTIVGYCRFLFIGYRESLKLKSLGKKRDLHFF